MKFKNNDSNKVVNTISKFISILLGKQNISIPVDTNIPFWDYYYYIYIYIYIYNQKSYKHNIFTTISQECWGVKLWMINNKVMYLVGQDEN